MGEHDKRDRQKLSAALVSAGSGVSSHRHTAHLRVNNSNEESQN